MDESNPFKKILDELNKKLTKISESIASSEKNLNKKITTSEQKVIDHIDSKYNELSEQIVKLEERITLLENETTQQSAKIQALESESVAKSLHIASLEMKINRCNLLFFNVEENEITPEELLTNIIRFFNEVMKVMIKHSDVDVVYRLGKEQPRKIRPVFIGLRTLKMRDYIYSCRRNLKGSKVSISEDCSKEIIEKRKLLLPALLGAKKSKKKAYFKLGTLLVNGSVRSDEDIVNYSKVYAESSKRRRPTDAVSPSNIPQEIKKPRSGTNVAQSLGRPRSLSLCNSPYASTSQQITQFFNTAPPSSPNAQTFFVQSKSDKP